jgi:hypothetical protein
VIDRETGTETTVAIRCGSTREAVCPPCADKARVLRMQQCAEGWHRTDEPEHHHVDVTHDQDDDQDDVDVVDRRRVRSTRRRDDVPSLPRKPAEDRTVGRVFTAPSGKEYRPSMFLTLTMPSYGAVRDGVPLDPATYDYRRAALDGLHFAKLAGRFWENLRRCAGYRVQYFAAVEPQHRLAPHLHAAIRGAIPRETLRDVVRGTYEQVWWPAFDTPVYLDRLPLWTGDGYCDPETGEMLPTWKQSCADLTGPAHVMQFGTQTDMRGLIAPSADADRAVKYLTKYLTKSIADAYTGEEPTPAYQRHVDRLLAELRFLPCSPRCANWLRYGIEPDHPGPGLAPGRCPFKSHDRENLGLGGRRVLVSREWSGRTLAEHRADRATVVREALLSAGMIAPEIERLAASVTASDGHPRFVWTDTRPDSVSYTQVILAAIAERQRWREQYAEAVDIVSATDLSPPARSSPIPR